MYKKIILFVAILAVSYFLFTYMKTNVLYQPLPAVPEKYDRFYQKLSLLVECQSQIHNLNLKTPDNILLHTIYLLNPDSNKCIIFFHGNSGNLSMRFDMIKFLYNYGSVIVFDYRSYGKSSTDSSLLSEYALSKDAETIWNYTVYNLGINPDKICLFGESLGCAVAINLAAKLSRTLNSNNYPHSIVLNAPFYSLSSMIENTFRKINIGFIGRLMSIIFGREYQSNDLIRFINYQTKIIIAHSLRDEVVPYKEGLNLYNTISQDHPSVKFITITGTHNNLGLTDNYIYALADLFN